MTGDPFISCRPFTKEDLCSPNPCGTNAQCVPGHDNTGNVKFNIKFILFLVIYKISKLMQYLIICSLLRNRKRTTW